MRNKKIFKSRLTYLSLIIITLSFIWGIGVGHYKWVPFYFIQDLKHVIFPNNTKQFTHLKSYDSRIFFKVISIDTSVIRNHTKNIDIQSLLLKRKNLIDKVTLKSSKNKIIKKKINNHSEKISVKIYNNNINAILTFASKPKKCLKIYIQGHGGNPFNYSYHNKLLKYFVSNGCDFLSMSMLGIGLNEGHFSYPSRYGEIKLTEGNMSQKHINYSFFYDKDNPNLDPLTLFISPHFNIIESLSENYEDISLMGISGGGWYTVWLAALLPKINHSISYAGTLPMEYGKFDDMGGDWEQQSSQVYDYVSYWELYKLMTIDDHGNINRKSTLVFNDEDSCCFFNPYAKHFKSELSLLNWKNLSVIIDKSKEHSMNVNLIKDIL